MTTAEKRAALAAAGEPWPDCTCHGEPMLWQTDRRKTGGGLFRCRIVEQEWRRNWRRSRQKHRECVACGQSTVNEHRCDACLAVHADYMATPKQRLLSQFSKGRRRIRQSDFQPTRVGQAALIKELRNKHQPGGAS